MPRKSFNFLSVLAGFIILQALPQPAMARSKKKDPSAFAVALPPTGSVRVANGAIFQSETYVALTTGSRASVIGDVLTVVLVENFNASKSNSATSSRTGDVGLTPPTTGPLNLIKPSDVKASGNQSFKGKGEASQSNALSGEISVTVAAVYPNGTMLVRGEKLLTLNRGDEHVQLSGLVRVSDITSDNKVLSSRVADARIRYIGKGEVARASKQGWLQRFFSKVSPF